MLKLRKSIISSSAGCLSRLNFQPKAVFQTLRSFSFPVRFDRAVAHLGDSLSRSQTDRDSRRMHEKYSAQFDKVKRILLDTNMFSTVMVDTEAEEYYNNLGLNEYYFQTASPQMIASNLQCVIAAKVLNNASQSDLFPLIQQETADEMFWMCRSSLLNRKQSQNLELEEKLERSYFGHPSPDDGSETTPWRLQCYRSTGSIFDEGLADSERLRLYFLQRPGWPLSSVSATETDLHKVADSFFASTKRGTATEEIYSRLNREAAKDHSGLKLFISTEERNDGMRIDLAFRRSPITRKLFSTVGDTLSMFGLYSRRKYLEPLANGISLLTTFVDALPDPSERPLPHLSLHERVASFSAAIKLQHITPRGSFSYLSRDRILNVHEAAYCSAIGRFVALVPDFSIERLLTTDSLSGQAVVPNEDASSLSTKSSESLSALQLVKRDMISSRLGGSHVVEKLRNTLTSEEWSRLLSTVMHSERKVISDFLVAQIIRKYPTVFQAIYHRFESKFKPTNPDEKEFNTDAPNSEGLYSFVSLTSQLPPPSTAASSTSNLSSYDSLNDFSFYPPPPPSQPPTDDELRAMIDALPSDESRKFFRRSWEFTDMIEKTNFFDANQRVSLGFEVDARKLLGGIESLEGVNRVTFIAGNSFESITLFSSNKKNNDKCNSKDDVNSAKTDNEETTTTGKVHKIEFEVLADVSVVEAPTNHSHLLERLQLWDHTVDRLRSSLHKYSAMGSDIGLTGVSTLLVTPSDDHLAHGSTPGTLSSLFERNRVAAASLKQFGAVFADLYNKPYVTDKTTQVETKQNYDQEHSNRTTIYDSNTTEENKNNFEDAPMMVMNLHTMDLLDYDSCEDIAKWTKEEIGLRWGPAEESKWQFCVTTQNDSTDETSDGDESAALHYKNEDGFGIDSNIASALEEDEDSADFFNHQRKNKDNKTFDEANRNF